MLLLERLILHYHRDYPSNQAIIIEIEPELIRIISFPGIDRSIPMRVIEAGERFSSRYYRNKRLGEFLKELELSEGKINRNTDHTGRTAEKRISKSNIYHR